MKRYLALLSYRQFMMKEEKSIYSDRMLITCILPVLSFFIVISGSDYDLAYIASSEFLYIVFITFLEVVIVWGFIRAIIKLLDKYMPLTSVNAKKRYLYQFTSTFLIYLILRIVIIYFEYTFLDWSQNYRIILNSEIPIEISFVILINLLYIYWRQVAYNANIQEKEVIRTENNTSKPRTLEIKKNKKSIFLDYNKIAFIYISNTITYLITRDNETHLITETLSQMHDLLGEQEYYRVNRQFLVHKSAIQAYKILPNRQIQVTLAPTSEVPCKLNKNNFKSFKNWLTCV